MRLNRQQWRERKGIREKRDAWCETISTMERERDERPWREKSLIKGIWKWVRVNRQRWREREGWCERVSVMERERDERSWREKTQLKGFGDG